MYEVIENSKPGSIEYAHPANSAGREFEFLIWRLVSPHASASHDGRLQKVARKLAKSSLKLSMQIVGGMEILSPQLSKDKQSKLSFTVRFKISRPASQSISSLLWGYSMGRIVSDPEMMELQMMELQMIMNRALSEEVYRYFPFELLHICRFDKKR